MPWAAWRFRRQPRASGYVLLRINPANSLGPPVNLAFAAKMLFLVLIGLNDILYFATGLKRQVDGVGAGEARIGQCQDRGRCVARAMGRRHLLEPACLTFLAGRSDIAFARRLRPMKTVLRLAHDASMSCRSSLSRLCRSSRRAVRAGRSISPASGRRCFTKISRNAFPVRTSATTWACRSTRRRACTATAGTRRILTLPEHQCKPHPADYSPRGPANLRIWREIDHDTQQLVAIHTHISWQQPERTIWMDGRPHPPEYAAHTWQGFSTGKWDGDMLTVTTTHLKMGWIRRNGIPRSDKAVLTEHFVRHGDYLTLISVDQRSGVSDRAVRPHDELGARSASADRAVSRARPSSRSSGRRARCRTTCRGRTTFLRSSRPSTTCRSSRRAAGPRRCIRSTLRKLQAMTPRAEAGEVG